MIDPVRNTYPSGRAGSVFPVCTDLSLPAAEPSYIHAF